MGLMSTKVVLHSPAEDFDIHGVDIFGQLPDIGHLIKIKGRKYPVTEIVWSQQSIDGKDYLSPIVTVGRQVV